MMVHIYSASSSATTTVMKKFADFAFIVMYRRQFIAAREDMELS